MAFGFCLSLSGALQVPLGPRSLECVVYLELDQSLRVLGFEDLGFRVLGS